MKFSLIAFTLSVLVSTFAISATEMEISGTTQVAHENTAHLHGGPDCTHQTVKHEDHMDYIHDGQLHALHGSHSDNHGTLNIALKLTDHPHKHGKNCGHKAVAHGDHTDYDHNGHLHAVHGDHFDDHTLLARSH